MQQIDDLLNQYGNIKEKFEGYSTELESKRAEIEGIIKLSSDDSYENSNWKVSMVKEHDSNSITIPNFKEAISNVNLTEEQIEILNQAIKSTNNQEHIRIKKL